MYRYPGKKKHTDLVFEKVLVCHRNHHEILNFIYNEWRNFQHKSGYEIIYPRLIHCVK